jgi:hypothetical protein
METTRNALSIELIMASLGENMWPVVHMVAVAILVCEQLQFCCVQKK